MSSIAALLLNPTSVAFRFDAGFMPHGMCYLWRPDLLGLHIAADASIAMAYFSIPVTLVYFARRRRDLQMRWIVMCFAIFIVACGATHLMDIWVIWHPDYWLSGAIKALTAVASVVTAILLMRLVPAALRLPSPAALQSANRRLIEEVADRRRAEAALQEAVDALRAERARERLTAIIDSSEDAIVSKTTDGVITSWNAAAERLFGYTAAEALGRPVRMLFPADRLAEEDAILQRIRRGENVPHFETQRLRKDGTTIDVSVTISPIRDQGGAIVGASKIARDISERKRVESRLAAQLARLDLLNNITRAIGERQDLPSIFKVVIRSLEEELPIDFGCLGLIDPTQQYFTVVSTGVSGPWIDGDPPLADDTQLALKASGLSRCVEGILLHEPDAAASDTALGQRMALAGLGSIVAAPLQVESKIFGILIAARASKHGFSSSDCEFLRQVSEHVALAAHQAELYGALESAYQDLRQTQQAVMEQERLRVIGQMASGIAHDINNALSPAMLYCQMLLDHSPELTDESRGRVAIIETSIDSVAQSVARMKDCYRPRESQNYADPVLLNREVQQVLELTRARWQSMPQERGIVITVDTDLEPALPAILGSASEIRDALTNLILNAVDAMPQGGRLTLRSGTRDADRVAVEVIDTGVGMDAATRERCLEAFFTTKGERGSGLGLAMVHGTMQRHGGEVRIHSEPGEGTRMELLFLSSGAPAEWSGNRIDGRGAPARPTAHPADRR